jgi:uncharacterized membrane protein YraQ (UPF0718 family)
MTVLLPRLNELVVVFISIVLQSLPFVLIGVFASVLVQQYLSERFVLRWMPRGRLSAVLAGSLFGLVAPVCDCGAVPLGRRLAAKGVPPPAALAFILAAPVVNPVVLLATSVAFQGNWGIVALRMAMTLSVALAVGLLSSAVLPTALRAAPLPMRGGSLDLAEPTPRAAERLGRLLTQANAEFFEIGFFIVLGALFTAATQTLVPRGDLAAVGADRVRSVLALMPVATLLSICSEADAFVARAFATTFTTGSVLAFMTIGQIVDLRNGALLVRALGGRAVAVVVVVAYVLVFIEALIINESVPRF